MKDDEREECGKEPREQMVSEIIVKNYEETIQALIEAVALFRITGNHAYNARVEI
jgi:hypothetical protein